MGNKHLTAEEAHKLSTTSECTMNRVYKFIDMQARENETKIFYSFPNTEPSVIRRVLDDLRNNGYKTKPVAGSDCTEYEIIWGEEINI